VSAATYLGDVAKPLAGARRFADARSLYRTAWREYLAAEIVSREGIDLIHSHFAWPTGSGGRLASAASRTPLVASLRGTDILQDDSIGYGRRTQPLFDQSLRRLLRCADRTVYFSDFMRDHGVALGARPEKARVIRKGVDLSQFAVSGDRLALKRELGLPPRPMVLTVGGLIPRKGINVVLEALHRMRNAHDFTFVVCGDGPDRGRLGGIADQLGMRDRTVFAGHVDRTLIPKYFAACDLFVLASTMEAAGNVLFEAMASGRPVVCTDAGGPQEYVVDGQTGYVVPVGDVDALAARIEKLLVNPELQTALGLEGRRRAVEDFSYRRMVEDLMNLYDDVLRRQPAARLAV
jgi:phosphatidylinositol alpha-1,6-mannosyltransferase